MMQFKSTIHYNYISDPTKFQNSEYTEKERENTHTHTYTRILHIMLKPKLITEWFYQPTE